MISIIVADDHAIVRRGLREILDERTGMVVRGEAPSGAEVLRLLQTQQVDILLLDMHLPDANGLQLLNQIRQDWPQIPVLVLSTKFEPEMAVRAIRCGAAGCLTQDTSPEQLVQAVHQVLRGRRYITQDLAECMATELGKNQTPLPHDMLSSRENQVLRMLGNGQPIKEIAYELELSEKTISTYRARILDKLGLRSSAELIRYAIEQKIC